MTPSEQRAALAESLKMLASHEPFQRFMEQIDALREAVIRDSFHEDVVANPNKIAACLGEVRCYTTIKDLVAEFRATNVDIATD